MSEQDAHHLHSHAESRQTTVISVCVVFAAISSSMLTLRLYLRCRVLKAAGLDDWTMLIAQVNRQKQDKFKRAMLTSRRQMLAITVSVSTIMGMPLLAL